jgi:hypothetical protein
MEREKKTKAKKAYQKPELTTIELNVDEVLAVGCKLVGGAGPLDGHCNPGRCSTKATS